MSTNVITHELPFTAPIPRGHEVLVAVMRRAPDSLVVEHLVLDETTSTLYCTDGLRGPLGRHTLATTDPIAVLTRWTWTVERAQRGTVVGAIVSESPRRGPEHDQSTLLFVEPRADASPYR
jgi:hypothetical protein